MTIINRDMIRASVLLIAFFLIIVFSHAQVAINNDGSVAHASAMLDVSSSNGGILMPRFSSVKRELISDPADGLLVFDTTSSSFWYFDNAYSGWTELVTSTSQNINGLSDGKSDGSSIYFGVNAGDTDDNSTNNNIGIGNKALNNMTDGENNVAIGSNSLLKVTDKSGLVAIGFEALKLNGFGSTISYESQSNTAVGYMSLTCNTTGFTNTALGYNSMRLNTIGSANTAVGESCLYSNTEGDANTAIGLGAMYTNTTGNQNTAIGKSALQSNTFGSYNTSIGVNSMWANVNGRFNTAIGNSSLYSNEYGDGNIGLGYKSLYSNYSGDDNIAIGYLTLSSNTTGNRNMAIGKYSLSSNTSGGSNISIGTASLYSNTTGGSNLAIGGSTLYTNTTGYANMAIGSSALHDNTVGHHNTAIGYTSLHSNTEGQGNTAIGYSSFYYNQTGSNNTIIGYEAGKGTSLNNNSGNIFLGYQAGYNETGSNKLYIENSNSSTPLIGGNFTSDEVYFNTTKLGIGTSNPNELVEIASPTNVQARLVLTDGGGSLRNALLFVSPKASNQTARIEAYDYGGAAGLRLNFNTVGDGQCVFGGDVLPEGHKTEDLGGNGQAWNNVYAHNYVTQGSAAFANISVTKQIISFPPIEKSEGSFDEFTEKGLKELDPASLPENLRENNAILIDEMTTYNYKANYEQQLQIEELQTVIEKLLEQNEMQTKMINELIKLNSSHKK